MTSHTYSAYSKDAKPESVEKIEVRDVLHPKTAYPRENDDLEYLRRRNAAGNQENDPRPGKARFGYVMNRIPNFGDEIRKNGFWVSGCGFRR